MRSADPALVRMSRSFGASPARVLATVVPGAVPHTLTGIRQSVAHGLTGVVVGEVFSAGTGLGYVLNESAQLFRTDRLFAVRGTAGGDGDRAERADGAVGGPPFPVAGCAWRGQRPARFQRMTYTSVRFSRAFMIVAMSIRTTRAAMMPAVLNAPAADIRM